MPAPLPKLSSSAGQSKVAEAIKNAEISHFERLVHHLDPVDGLKQSFVEWYGALQKHLLTINSAQLTIDYARWREANGYDVEAVRAAGYGWLAYRFSPEKLLPLYEKYASGAPVPARELPWPIYEKGTAGGDLRYESRPKEVLDHVALAVGNELLEKQFLQETGWTPSWRVVVVTPTAPRAMGWDYFAVRTDGQKEIASAMRTYYGYTGAAGGYGKWAPEAHFKMDPAYKPSKPEYYEAVKQRFKAHRFTEYKLPGGDVPGFRVDLDFRVKDLPAIPLHPGPGDRATLERELRAAHEKALRALEAARKQPGTKAPPAAPKHVKK